MLTKDPSLLGMLRVTVCSAWLLAIVSGQHLLGRCSCVVSLDVSYRIYSYRVATYL